MLYLNIRHQLPQISIHQNQSRLDKSAMKPAVVHGNNEQAQSNKGVTQSSIEIDNYPSRRAYGSRTMDDYTRERGQKGISDAQSSVTSRMHRAWSFAEEGAKRGDDIPQKYKSDMMAKYAEAKTLAHFSLMSGPNIRVNEGQVVGEPSQGDVTAEIESEHYADIDFTPGSAETTVADKGFVRAWVTEGHYDIYA